MAPLAKRYKEVIVAAGVVLNESHVRKLAECEANSECLEIVINQWKSGSSDCPQTWKSLIFILANLDLIDLSHQIRDCLSKRLQNYSVIHVAPKF